jgi:hypothetical protein
MTGEPVRQGPARPGPAARSAMAEDPMPGDTGPESRVPENRVPEDPVPGNPVPGNPAPQAPAQERSSVRRLCAIVLIMETVVIWLSIPVALAVNRASPSRIGVAGVVLAVAAVALAALARRRPRWTIIGGTVLQVLVIAAGTIVPVMYFLGAIFAALWVIGIGLGRRLDAAP